MGCFHLAALQASGLVCSERDRRRVVYRADLEAMRALMRYLTRDCCGGNPEICADLIPVVAGADSEHGDHAAARVE